MWTRIWTTRFDTGRRDELQRFADEVSAPMFRRLPGCRGYVYAVSDGTWITQTFWDSVDAIRVAEASESYGEVVARIVAQGFLRGAPTTEVFEVTSYAAPPA